MKTAIFLTACLIVTPCAYAENKLFPTDILEKGQADISASAQYENYSRGLNFSGANGKQSLAFTGEGVGVKYGLGSNWQIAAGTSYTSRAVVKTEWDTGGRFDNDDGEGPNNPYLSATYGIINDTANPLSLSIRAAVSPKTTDTSSSYLTELSAGWKNSETLKFYSSLRVTVFNDRDYSDNFNLQVGAYQEISPSVTLIPYAYYRWQKAGEWSNSSSDYGIGLKSNIQLQKNTYLTAAIANFGLSSTSTKDGLFRSDATSNGLLINIGLYHLF